MLTSPLKAVIFPPGSEWRGWEFPVLVSWEIWSGGKIKTYSTHMPATVNWNRCWVDVFAAINYRNAMIIISELSLSLCKMGPSVHMPSLWNSSLKKWENAGFYEACFLHSYNGCAWCRHAVVWMGEGVCHSSAGAHTCVSVMYMQLCELHIFLTQSLSNCMLGLSR